MERTRIRKKLYDLWKDNCSYLGRLRISGAVMLALSFMFLFFGPLEIVAFSGGSLVFTYQDVLSVLVVMLLAGLAMAPLLALLRGRIFHYVICILCTCTLGGYLQAMFLNGGLGLLTGDTIGWNGKTTTAIVSLGMWELVLIFFLFVMYLHRKFWSRMVCAISLLLVVMQLVPTVSILCGGYDEVQPDDMSKYHLSEEGFSELSTGENVFVFVLDRLDYDYIEKSLQADPDFLDGLDGFTSYTNAISTYARTQPALVHMLTGTEDITYMVPEEQYFTDVWNQGKTNLLQQLQTADYDIRFYTNIRNLFSDPAFVSKYVENVCTGESDINKTVAAKKMLELSAFRYAPTVIKPFVWQDTNYFNADIFSALESEDFAEYQFNDAAYAAQLKAATAETTKNSFRFYHFYGPHSPYTMKADGTASGTETTVTEQTIGSFTNLIGIFSRMKELGIYDDATIIITGDHGAAMNDYKPLIKATRIGLFYKPSGASGTPLQYSKAPVSVKNIPATLAKAIGAEYSSFGTPLDEVSDDADITRIYYKSVCDENYVETQVCVYEVTGDAADFENWVLVDTVAIPYSYN